MDDQELDRLADRLDLYVGDVFNSLPRVDQRYTAALYLRGLILDTPRKSMKLLGERLGVDHQRLQQFVTSSPWDPRGPVARLVQRTICLLDPTAWVIVEWSTRKSGRSSVCVAPQRGASGMRTTNCQVAVMIWAAGMHGAALLGWRLFVPRSWDDRCAMSEPSREAIARRRRSCGIPDSVRHRASWRLVLDMIDELRTDGWRPPLIVGRATSQFTPGLVTGLGHRGIRFGIAEGGPTPLPAMRRAQQRRGPPRTIDAVVVAAQGGLADASRLGLGDFEGRSWRGWHHHVALTAAAQGFELIAGLEGRRSTDHQGRLRSKTESPEPSRPLTGRAPGPLPRLSPAVERALLDQFGPSLTAVR